MSTDSPEFPPLPKGEVMALGTIGGKYIELIRYTENDMRAYVLADRALRPSGATEALQKLLERCDDSDDACYGTLSVSFVREIANAALTVPNSAGRLTKLAEANETQAPWDLDVHQVSAPVEISSCATCGHPVESGGERPAAAGQWIGVDERLPPIGTWCNVLYDRESGDYFDRLNKPRFTVYGAQLFDVDSEGYATWRRWIMPDGGPIGSLYLVTHWMELPQPPLAASDSQESGSTECKESSPLSPANPRN